MKKQIAFIKKVFIGGSILCFSFLNTACFQNNIQGTNVMTKEGLQTNQKTTIAAKDSSMPQRKYPVVPDTSIVYIYLSFDDGPNNGTPHLLKVLNEQQTAASLFLVGKHVYGSKFQKTVFEKYKEYSWLELCNHSFTHANHQYKAFYANPEKVVADFMECHDSLKFTTKISRAPGFNMWSINGDSTRFRTKTASAEKLKEAGFQMIGWDADWDFKNIPNHQQMLKRLVELENNKYPMQYPSYYPKHLVLLLHDQSFTDPLNCEELKQFIHVINSMPKKYCFKKISEYPLLNLTTKAEDVN